MVIRINYHIVAYKEISNTIIMSMRSPCTVHDNSLHSINFTYFKLICRLIFQFGMLTKPRSLYTAI